MLVACGTTKSNNISCKRGNAAFIIQFLFGANNFRVPVKRKSAVVGQREATFYISSMISNMFAIGWIEEHPQKGGTESENFLLFT